MEHLEGRQSVLAALQAFQRRFHVILIRQGIHEERVADVLAAATARNVPIRYASREELDALAHGATHGGVLAICSPKPRWSAEDLLKSIENRRTPALLLLIEGVDDARNLGFTLRTADACGADAVLIKKHLWDFEPVEVARPASGAYERLPLVQIDTVEPLKSLQRRGVTLVGCIAKARRTIYDVDFTRPTILAIGGEKRGLSGAVRDHSDVLATIPTRDGASLSLSHAAAIVLAEAMRQRGGPRAGE